MVADGRDRDAFHAGGAGSLHTGHGIFEHDTVLRRHSQSFGRDLKHLWIRLAARRVFCRDKSRKVRPGVREFQDQVEIRSRMLDPTA